MREVLYPEINIRKLKRIQLSHNFKKILIIHEVGDTVKNCSARHWKGNYDLCVKMFMRVNDILYDKADTSPKLYILNIKLFYAQKKLRISPHFIYIHHKTHLQRLVLKHVRIFQLLLDLFYKIITLVCSDFVIMISLLQFVAVLYLS